MAAGEAQVPDAPEVLARVRDALDVVAHVAAQTRRALSLRLDRHELESFGNEGLLRAARSFDATRGVPFRAWATLRVRGAIIDGVRSSGTLPRRVYQQMKQLEAADEVIDALVEEDSARPVTSPADADERLSRYAAAMATAMALSGDKRISHEMEAVADDAPTPEALAAKAELFGAVRAAIDSAPEQERRVLQRYYFDEAPLDEIGKELGLSKSWVSRIHTRAIGYVTRELKRQRAGP